MLQNNFKTNFLNVSFLRLSPYILIVYSLHIHCNHNAIANKCFKIIGFHSGFFLLATQCGMWDLTQPGIKPMAPLQWKFRVLTTRQ